ncbi:MAG: hypothetical protein CM15mP85_04180 [Rhodobacterales bacterium]|nr:MAG: hypothetical protein CM15mP85_04180 [Rhodobacterales bacterium]
MQVTAKVTIQNATYEAWYDFFSVMLTGVGILLKMRK